MRKLFYTTLAGFILFFGCAKDTVKEKYSYYVPVYKTKAQVRAEAKASAPVDLQEPGKLFIKDNYVFLTEINKGIHVIDFSDPKNPKNISFINIPGCLDLAVRGNYLYVDCYTDLVTMDISDPKNVVVKQFLEGVFPHRKYINGFVADTTRVITEWIIRDTLVESTFQKRPIWDARILYATPSNAQSTTSSANKSVTNGIGGSLARFGLLGERMYTISMYDMKVFNTVDASKPTYVKTLNFTQGNIETIFPYKNKLFIGSQTGMFIYDASDPDNPIKLGTFSHARVCDPVVADDKYAFVTLRSNSTCAGFLNQLDVVDIGNVMSPILLKSYQLTEPIGLSKDGNTLLICDGKDGLKIFNATNPIDIKLIKKIPGFEPQDVITVNGVAIVMAKDGLYFISYSDPANASVLSKITIQKP